MRRRVAALVDDGSRLDERGVAGVTPSSAASSAVVRAERTDEPRVGHLHESATA
ncbi:hypothetical protein [Nonomuraea dietziae]|uniref:hypothetical protein n=1 Tax=Nonomuraea dietziae TaxID=65515 RepID=UPI0031D2D719